MKNIFGPVPSRRLGMSLGVDLIPFKTCSYDCIYCELGKTTNKTSARKEYISKDIIFKQLEEYLVLLDSPPDYITISGSGEPTLNSKLGEIIRHIKGITKIPVAVLTNSSLLFMDEVRKDLLEADIVLPSLDAVSSNIFSILIDLMHDLLSMKSLVVLSISEKNFPARSGLKFYFAGQLMMILQK